MPGRILVLHSGGMDSTVCLYRAHESKAEVISLGVDYGQRLSIEMIFAQRQCDQLGIRREIARVSWQKPQREIPVDRSISEIGREVSTAFLPGRNAIFLSLANAYAAGLEATEVHIGLNSVDFSGYPDCTPEFLEAFRRMMEIAIPNGAKIVAPLQHLSKPQIAREAARLGIGEYDTWSCYRPQLKAGAIAPCGICDACKLHR